MKIAYIHSKNETLGVLVMEPKFSARPTILQFSHEGGGG